MEETAAGQMYMDRLWKGEIGGDEVMLGKPPFKGGDFDWDLKEARDMHELNVGRGQNIS